MWVDDDDLRDVRREDPRDLRRVAGDLQQDAVIGRETRDDELTCLRRGLDEPAERNSPPRTIATPQKSRCTSIPIALNTASSSSQDGSSGGQTTQTDSCSQHNQVSRRGGQENSGLSAHQPMHGLPICVLPRSPCPGESDRTAGTGQQREAAFSCPETVPLPAGRARAFRAVPRFTGAAGGAFSTGAEGVHFRLLLRMVAVAQMACCPAGLRTFGDGTALHRV